MCQREGIMVPLRGPAMKGCGQHDAPPTPTAIQTKHLCGCRHKGPGWRPAVVDLSTVTYSFLFCPSRWPSSLASSRTWLRTAARSTTSDPTPTLSSPSTLTALTTWPTRTRQSASGEEGKKGQSVLKMNNITVCFSKLWNCLSWSKTLFFYPVYFEKKSKWGQSNLTCTISSDIFF